MHRKLKQFYRNQSVLILFLLFHSLQAVSAARADEYDQIIEEALSDIEKASEQLNEEILNAEVPPAAIEKKVSQELVVEKPPKDFRSVGILEISAGLITSLEIKSQPVRDVLEFLSVKTALPIELIGNVQGDITLSVQNVEAKDALRIILDMGRLAFKEEGGVTKVMTKEAYQLREGHPFVQNFQTKTVALQYADPLKVRESLQGMKSISGKVILDERTKTFILLDSPNIIEAMTELVRQMDAEIQTQTFSLSHRKVDDLKPELEKIITKDVGIVALNLSTNTVAVTDTESKIKESEGFIKNWDQPQLKIQMQTKILQVMLNEENKMGIDWEAIVSDYQSVPFSGFMGVNRDSSKYNVSAGVLSDEDFGVLLEALDTVGVINTITEDKREEISGADPVTVILHSDQVSSIVEGKNKSIFAGSSHKVEIGVFANIINKEDGKKAFKLTVDPKIYSSNGVALYPVIDSENSIFKAELALGHTLIVGGLFKDIVVESTRKIPFLGDIPILGFAFRNQGESLQRTEVILFLTPGIISTP
jgi:type II secretory pathway component GspD/PulD (secretin)